jgi:hypothetical protein
MREWDPIGIADIPQAKGEYDSYVAEAYVMLMDKMATAEAIAAYLLDIATRHMGLSHTARLMDCSERTAKRLLALRSEFETH